MKWEIAPHSKEYQCINTASINVSRFFFHLLILTITITITMTIIRLLFSLTILSCCHTSFTRTLLCLEFSPLCSLSFVYLLWQPDAQQSLNFDQRLPSLKSSRILPKYSSLFWASKAFIYYFCPLFIKKKKKKKSSSTTIMERSPGGRHGNLLQYSFLENPLNREAWWATVHGAVKSRAWLKRLSKHNCEGGMRTQKREVQRSSFSTL